tara:strand:+ start:363 stop:539 length:177 start_codon:yes stop_codon:yes gene_type:complete
MDINNKTVLTVEETAKYLNVSRDLIYREIKKGNIPHIKLGRVNRIPVYALRKKLGEID